MNQQFVSTHQVESGFQGNHKRYPTQFSGHLTSDLDQHLAELDGTTYKVWSCLNRLLDSRAVNCQGYYLGYTVRVSQENLAERVGMSVRSVRRHLSKLEASGIIQVERPVFGCNRYRLMGYVDAIEKQIDPATPSLETVDRFIEQDALSPDPVADTKAEDTAVLSRGQDGVPSRGQDGVLHNRPSLRDKSIIDSLSGPEVDEAEKVDEGETGEREGLADLFYQEVLGEKLRSENKRREIDAVFADLLNGIEAEDCVENQEQARAILADAFKRVKTKTAPIWSHNVMTTNHGEKAIEEAIKAQSVSSLDKSSFPSVEPPSPSEPTASKESPLESHEKSAAPPSTDERIREALRDVTHKDRDRIADSARRHDREKLDGISEAEIVAMWREMQAENEAIRLSRHSRVDRFDGGLAHISEAA